MNFMNPNYIAPTPTLSDSSKRIATTEFVQGLSGQSGVINVKTYGATGQFGDYTSAIQAAVAAMPSDLGAIYFPPGVYFISSTISMGTKGRWTLYGINGATIIILADGSNCDMFTVGDNNTYVQGITFDGIWFSGNRSNQSGSSSCIVIQGCEFPTIRNCFVRSALTDNISCRSSGSQLDAFPIIQDNIIIDDAGRHNIYLGPNCFGTKINNNNIRTSGRVTAGGAGVYCDNNAESLIAGNVFDENGIHVHLFSTDRSNVSGNSMLSSERHGILGEADCTDSTISGNEISNSGLATSNTYSGIIYGGINSTISGNTISTVTATMLNGIAESGSADNNTIIGNVVSGATNKIVTVGAATTVAGNNSVPKANSGMLAANGTVATVLGSLGPAGSNTTVQEWLVYKNSAGVDRYIPMF